MGSTFMLLATIAMVSAGPVDAVTGPSGQSPGSRGGKVQRVADFQVEVVCRERVVDVYVYDAKGEPIDATKLRGRLVVQTPDQPQRHRYDLYPATTAGGTNRLSVSADLGRFDAADVRAKIYRLPTNARSIEIATTYRRRPATPLIPVATNAKPTKATAADSRAVRLQRLCPVANLPLNSMGGPWRVSVQGQPLYICCPGCVGRLRKDPDRYLKKAASLVANAASDTVR